MAAAGFKVAKSERVFHFFGQVSIYPTSEVTKMKTLIDFGALGARSGFNGFFRFADDNM